MAQIGRKREAKRRRTSLFFQCIRFGQTVQACSAGAGLYVFGGGPACETQINEKGGAPILTPVPYESHLIDSLTLRHFIESALDADKAIDIETIDLRGQTTIADYMTIASGRSSTQIVSTATKLAERLRALGVPDIRIEGAGQGDWVIVDAGDVIVHLFRPEIRAFYDLARMWRPLSTGPVTDMFRSQPVSG